MSSASFTVQPVQYADIPRIARIGEDCFKADVHTQVKKLGKLGYDMEEMSRKSLMRNLRRERYVHLKAVDDKSGNIIGSLGFYFMGVDLESVPKLNYNLPEASAEEEEDSASQEATTPVDKIAQLEEIENKDMSEWQEKLSPAGSKCLIIFGISVAPEYQGHGVGPLMLQSLIKYADDLGIYIWVHSSEAAWKMFEKNGFEVVGEFVVDLDEWAPHPPPAKDGESHPKWGRYVCRYMKRLPKA